MKGVAHHVAGIPQALVTRPSPSFIERHGGEDAAIGAIVSQLAADGATEIAVVETIPPDRVFRDAWRVQDGVLFEDPAAAREIAKEILRRAREAKLRELMLREFSGENVAADKALAVAFDPAARTAGKSPDALRAELDPPALRRGPPA